MVASGASWEPTALGMLGARNGVVVLKRCVDVNDLLATATAGQADVAVLSLDAPGLDSGAVEHLRRHRVRPVAIVADPESDAIRARAARIGIPSLVGENDLDRLPDAVAESGEIAAEPITGTQGLPVLRDQPGLPMPVQGSRVIAVWGPQGAPGRSTVAVGIASELAHRGASTMLVDADPWGGAVAQQLGILDEVSGLLAAARLSASGDLSHRFHTVQRVAGDGLRVVTGLPRPDRWVEIRPGTIEHIVELGRELGHTVLDTGFCLEDDRSAEFGTRPSRNGMTLAALAEADEIVVVGNADPVGLSRLARGLVDLREVTGGVPVRVVVNRMRSSLGWAEKDVAAMVEGFARIRGLHFLPDDRPAADRSLVAGQSLVEAGESALARGIAGLTDVLVPESVGSVAAARARRNAIRFPAAGTPR